MNRSDTRAVDRALGCQHGQQYLDTVFASVSESLSRLRVEDPALPGEDVDWDEVDRELVRTRVVVERGDV